MLLQQHLLNQYGQRCRIHLRPDRLTERIHSSGILRTPVANMTKIAKDPDIEGWGKLTLKEDDRRSRPADSTEFTPLLSS